MDTTVSRFEVHVADRLTRVPIPLGWRVLIAMRPVETTTKGGIILPDQHLDAKQTVATVGYVVSLGPTAYQREEMGYRRWVAPGDTVLVAKYAGQRHDTKVDGQIVELRLINDDEVQAVFADENPPAWLSLLIAAAGPGD